MTTMRTKPPLPTTISARPEPPPIESDAGLSTRLDTAGDKAPLSPPARIEVRWRCTASACAALVELPPEQLAVHALAEFMLVLTATGDDRGHLEAHLVLGEHRRSIIVPKPVALIMHEHNEWRHLDALLDDRTILQLSWCGGEPRYAQTTLLADAGLPGGSYDRPWVTFVSQQIESRRESIMR